MTIHRDAAHPSMNAIRKTGRIRPLLEDKWTTIGAAQLPPPDAGYLPVWSSPRGHRLISYQRFMVAKVTIGKPKERPLSIAQVIDSIAGTWLRNTCSSTAA